MDRLWNQFSMRDTIASQLICHDFSGLTMVYLQQPFEELLSRFAISSGLQKYIHHLTILIHRTP